LTVKRRLLFYPAFFHVCHHYKHTARTHQPACAPSKALLDVVGPVSLTETRRAELATLAQKSARSVLGALRREHGDAQT
jgi:hypothetical protein